MTMENEELDGDLSVNESEETDNSAEQDSEETPKDDGKDFKDLYQNQKIRAEKAEATLKELKKGEETPKENKEPSQNTGELNESQLDYLDLKGISTDEDIAIVENIVKNTGQTVRQALKDDYVISKLEANKANREVKAATPGSTKRGGGQTDDVATALAKFDQNQELPEDFELRTKVVDAITERGNTNKPSWHK